MTTSRRGIEIIISFEKFRAKAYRDQGGVLTIGYGTTEGVKPGDVITEDHASERMYSHVEGVERHINDVVTWPLDQDQFDALVALVYNIGVGRFTVANCTLLRKLNAGKVCAATAQFSRWNKIKGKPSAGLAERRSAEAVLFAGDR